MGKFVVIKYEDLEKLKSNTQKLIENTIVDTRKINEARLSEIETIEALSNELSTDESIIDRAERYGHSFNKNDNMREFFAYKDGATEQSIIEQMKAKELNLQKNNECKNSSHDGEVKWTGKCSVCGSTMRN